MTDLSSIEMFVSDGSYKTLEFLKFTDVYVLEGWFLFPNFGPLTLFFVWDGEILMNSTGVLDLDAISKLNFFPIVFPKFLLIEFFYADGVSYSLMYLPSDPAKSTILSKDRHLLPNLLIASILI